MATFLKCEGSQLLFIDATSNGGVGICFWDDFLKKAYFKGYQRLVYRHLRFKRTAGSLKQLEEFVRVSDSPR